MQPLRTTVDTLEITAGTNIHDDNFRHIHIHNVEVALETMADMELTDALVEGGPRFASAFLEVDVVNAIESYTASTFLDAGLPVIPASHETTITDISRSRIASAETLGGDILVTAFHDGKDRGQTGQSQSCKGLPTYNKR